MKQYRDLLQEWLDYYDREMPFYGNVPKGKFYISNLIERTRAVIKQRGFPCTCERCTGIPDVESFYKDEAV